jgi:hypothetical protein
MVQDSILVELPSVHPNFESEFTSASISKSKLPGNARLDRDETEIVGY